MYVAKIAFLKAKKTDTVGPLWGKCKPLTNSCVTFRMRTDTAIPGTLLHYYFFLCTWGRPSHNCWNFFFETHNHQCLLHKKSHSLTIL
uniref:Uncharacterized protein n=1 Tax=Anguilla anguilla TaxID=7936 RepID=A0A0E9WBE5_ANGAN